MISIIGAGPSGSYLAYLLSKEGRDVQVFEEHESVGRPVQCTGLLTSSITRIIHSEKFIQNRIRTARVYAPDGKYAEFRFHRENLVINRTEFDRLIAEMAMSKGAEYLFGYMFIGKKDNVLKFRHKNRTKRVKTDILVGADGPDSSVARTFNKQPREFFVGAQATVKMRNSSVIEFYPYLRDMGWVVPESKSAARVGTASREKPAIFKDFLRSRLGDNYGDRVISHESGLIPVFNPDIKTHHNESHNDIYLLGDAATMVKATTAGGIIQAMTAAECLADAIIYEKNYEKLWRKRVGRDLFIHLIIRKVLDRFKESDYNQLISIFEKEQTREILNKYDRDFPAQFMLKLLLSDPSILRFLTKLRPRISDIALCSKIPKFI